MLFIMLLRGTGITALQLLLEEEDLGRLAAQVLVGAPAVLRSLVS